MSIKFNNHCWFLLLLVWACDNAPFSQAQLRLNALFSDGMVLQQASEVPIWGQGAPDRTVILSASWGAEAEARVDSSGNWICQLQTPEAGGPYQLEIHSGDSTAIIEDVLIGEVWLASGQSNMQMPLQGWPPNDPILNSDQEIADADNPNIRMFTVQRVFSASELDSLQGSWEHTTPHTAREFSASAYFFARRLFEELAVPVGIIHSSWGGTPAEAWTSAPKLRKLGDFNEELDRIGDPNLITKIQQWFAQHETIPVPATDTAWSQLDFRDGAILDSEFPFPEDMELPGRVDLIGSSSFDGVIWLERTFQVNNSNMDHELRIAAIDDMDATYINGHKVGGFEAPGYHNAERLYPIAADLLQPDDNTISIRVIDTGGPGAVNGPIEILADGGASIDLAGSWSSLPFAEIWEGKFYMYGRGTDLSQRPEIGRLNQNTPSALYNAMINPLVPYQIAGAIWYQGEANVSRAVQYQTLFPAMIGDWRDQWGYEFPFYFVQIAPYNYQNDLSPALRDAQRLALKTPRTGMVVTLDIGNPDNIHPGNKQEVGARLAGLALQENYQKDILASGPLFKGLTSQGSKLVVEFDHVGDGLVAAESGLKGFEVAGENGEFVEARAEIAGKVIEVSSPRVLNPKQVRYAWRDISEATLFNSAGLPASSFSSENGSL